MKRAIVGFDQDDENHWRAKLDCGHYQHMRHDPPLRVREWILTEAGRSERSGWRLIAASVTKEHEGILIPSYNLVL